MVQWQTHMQTSDVVCVHEKILNLHCNVNSYSITVDISKEMSQ